MQSDGPNPDHALTFEEVTHMSAMGHATGKIRGVVCQAKIRSSVLKRAAPGETRKANIP